jgi:glycosyltransferase involved in cell wall biosynthesis
LELSGTVRINTVTGAVGIVVPVFDDWDSLRQVLQEIACCSTGCCFDVIIVDDGSRAEPTADFAYTFGGSLIRSVEVIRLAINLGHQRAIAVGLAAAARRDDLQAVIVMDGDGEDRPGDIPSLLSLALEFPGHAVLAKRGRRSVRWQFRLGYIAYKVLFRVLTGSNIDFGNFSLLPIAAVRRLVHMPELWNNLAAAVMRSRLRSVRVSLDRGHRIAGRSRMNLAGLVLHGLSAMSVYSDLIFVRMLLAAVLAGGMATVGLLSVLTIRFASHYAIPGWASIVFGDLIIVLLQSIVMAVATTLIVLGNRSHRPIVPFLDAPAFIEDSQQWFPADRRRATRAVAA